MNFYLPGIFIIAAAVSVMLFYIFEHAHAKRINKRREKLANRQAELLSGLHNPAGHKNLSTDNED